MVCCNIIDNLFNDLEYAYVTIFDSNTKESLCEGISKVLKKSISYENLSIKSFQVFEVEDGSVLVDIYIQS